ncbi:MAG TPA: glycoside hydrolase family 172 protein [Chitinophagaceae bacterium]|nr:glycoside hydrolase family 172 protein [Chitinophagaceae bacterium]
MDAHVSNRTGRLAVLVLLVIGVAGCAGRSAGPQGGEELFSYSGKMKMRWSSPENRHGEKGSGGKENNSAKGHPYDRIAAGESDTLLDVSGPGIIQRIWITISDRSPDMLRSLKLEMFWDHESKPAVAVPFGDFFGVGLGRTAVFENALFANPEGRSFNCFIPMPFKKRALVRITNESDRDLRNIFYDVDYSLVNDWDDHNLFFHACWTRDTATRLARDFALLPKVSGRGRFLGVNIGVNANPQYGRSWFGEGEVKIYLDGDQSFPTLNGTGTEDYIGTAWGQGRFINRYTGCTLADDSLAQYSFYRFHIPDPIYFDQDCRVTMQQIGGDATDRVAAFQANNAPLLPVTTDTGRLVRLYEQGKVIRLADPGQPRGWTNFYRSDDVSAVAYFYLDKPADDLPGLAPVRYRKAGLRSP